MKACNIPLNGRLSPLLILWSSLLKLYIQIWVPWLNLWVLDNVPCLNLTLITKSFNHTISKNSNFGSLYPFCPDTPSPLIGGLLSPVWRVSLHARCGGAAWCSSRVVPFGWPVGGSLRPLASVPVPRRPRKGCAELGHWQDLRVGRLRNTRNGKQQSNSYTDS